MDHVVYDYYHEMLRYQRSRLCHRTMMGFIYHMIESEFEWTSEAVLSR